MTREGALRKDQSRKVPPLEGMTELTLPNCPQLTLESILADLKTETEGDNDRQQLGATLPGDLSLTELGTAYERLKELRQRLKQYRDILAASATTDNQRETHDLAEK